ncbi:MAG: hypothetical protein ACPG7F_12405 [Aggregatilineales bacterium]
MNDKNKLSRRPLVDPIILALKSRRVLIALVTLLVGILISSIPELAIVRSELLTLLMTLALALIGGYSVEDAARASRETQDTLPTDLRDQLKAIIDSLVDELLTPPEIESV